MEKEKLDKIRVLIKETPKPLSVHDLQQKSGITRGTIVKWIRVLEASGEIETKRVGHVLLVV